MSSVVMKLLRSAESGFSSLFRTIFMTSQLAPLVIYEEYPVRKFDPVGDRIKFSDTSYGILGIESPCSRSGNSLLQQNVERGKHSLWQNKLHSMTTLVAH